MQILVIQEIKKRRQICLFESFMSNYLVLVNLEVLFQKYDSVSSNLIVIVRTNAQNKFEH